MIKTGVQLSAIELLSNLSVKGSGINSVLLSQSVSTMNSAIKFKQNVAVNFYDKLSDSMKSSLKKSLKKEVKELRIGSYHLVEKKDTLHIVKAKERKPF